MPTYPLAFPTGAGLYPDAVKAMHRRVQATVESPFTLQRQVYDWGVSRWEISVTMQRMGATEAATFGTWLNDLGGIAGTFTFDLSPWVPGVSPGVRTFRLREPINTWDSDFSVEWGFQFDAIEADPSTGSVVNGQASPQIVQRGVVALASGVFSQAVTFPVAFASTPAVVHVLIAPPSGGSYIPAVVQGGTASASGFTALLGAATPALGYTLQWVAFQ